MHYEMEKNAKLFGERLTDRDLLTRVACELAYALSAGVAPTELAERWVAHHAQQDKAREIRERETMRDRYRRRRALKKLNPEDRAVLGLEDD